MSDRKRAREEGWRDMRNHPRDRVVLIVRKSGYSSTPWEFMSARYGTDKDRWEDIGGDSLTDTGEQPIAWKELPKGPALDPTTVQNFGIGFSIDEAELMQRIRSRKLVVMDTDDGPIFMGDLSGLIQRNE